MTVKEYMNKLVNGKRVAFVGLAPCISGMGLGKEIDKFDIVIRTNEHPLPNEYIADYGRKCDILVLHIKYTNEKYDVKNIMHYRTVKEKSPHINYCLITWDERMQVVNEVKRTINKNPIKGTQGTNMMHFCLEAGAKEFKMYGITGYQNKKGELIDSGSYINIKRRVKVKGKRVSRGITKSKDHNHEVLNDYTRYMLKTGAITMDKYSIKYFI